MKAESVARMVSGGSRLQLIAGSGRMYHHDAPAAAMLSTATDTSLNGKWDRDTELGIETQSVLLVNHRLEIRAHNKL
jgi:hypothetical protein